MTLHVFLPGPQVVSLMTVTSGTTEINSFGSRKTKPGKLGTETFPYARYSFEGKPALSLSVGDSGKESLYRGKN